MYEITEDEKILLARMKYKALDLLDVLADEAEATANTTHGCWEYGYWRGVQAAREKMKEEL